MNNTLTTPQDAQSVTPPAQSPVLNLSPELQTTASEQAVLTLNRAARRKAHKLKCQGHATHGAAERYYPVSAGREAIPQPTEAEREKILSFIPLTASQVNFIIKCSRKERVQEVTDAQGKVTRIAFKLNTRDEALLLGLHIEALKHAKRDDYVDQLLTYLMAPNGLGREDHQRTRALLERSAPRHMLDLAHNCDLPVLQDFIAEAQTAWDDPSAAKLALYEGEIPARPKVSDANTLIGALSERCALLPEPLRLVLKDLIKILSDCQASKLHDFMVKVQELLKLSSRDLMAALIDWGKQLPSDAGFEPLIHPQEFAAVGGDLRKRLQELMIAPKPKKAAAKKSTENKAAAKKPAENKAAPKPAEHKAAAPQPSTQRSATKAKTAAQQAMPQAAEPNLGAVTAAAASAVRSEELAGSMPPAPSGDCAGAPQVEAVPSHLAPATKVSENEASDAPQQEYSVLDILVEDLVVDPNGRYELAFITEPRALGSHRMLTPQQKAEHRKHNKAKRQQRKAARQGRK